jgi:TatD DNase family protein
MKYFDAHCHIQFPMFDEDREVLASRMETEAFGGIVVGVDAHSSEQAIALAQSHPHLWSAVGLHPNYTQEQEFNIEDFRRLAQHSKVVAIGECGLDNFRPENPDATRARQREVFEAHVQLAIELDKPLMIHARPTKGTQDAYQDLIEILRSYKQEHGERLRGDIHFFVGGIEEARALIELDFTLSYTAVLTFTHDYDDVVRFIPLTHLLSETDSPYVAPVSRRGQRNDPFSVRDVVTAMSAIRGEDEETVRAAVLSNARRVFGI